MITHKFLSRALLISAVALLPACKPFDWGKKEGGCGCPHAVEEELKIEGINPAALKETVVSFEGRPVVRGEDFERSFQQIMEGQPQLKDMLPFIPDEQKDQMFGQFAESIATEKIIQRYVHDTKMDQTPEYRRNSKNIHEAVDKDLSMRAFENELAKEIVITDDEGKKFYEGNRATDQVLQRPPFVTQQGGVKAQAFEAANEKEANELSAKSKTGDFTKVAKDAKKTVNDYGVVGQQSFIDADVKNKILAATKFPSIFVVKGSDNKYRVVRVGSKQETKYADFDKVKDQIMQLLKRNKFQEIYTKKMAELKDKYKVEVNKDYVNLRKIKAAVEAKVEDVKAELEGKEGAGAEAAPKPQAA